MNQPRDHTHETLPQMAERVTAHIDCQAVDLDRWQRQEIMRLNRLTYDQREIILDLLDAIDYYFKVKQVSCLHGRDGFQPKCPTCRLEQARQKDRS